MPWNLDILNLKTEELPGIEYFPYQTVLLITVRVEIGQVIKIKVIKRNENVFFKFQSIEVMDFQLPKYVSDSR